MMKEERRKTVDTDDRKTELEKKVPVPNGQQKKMNAIYLKYIKVQNFFYTHYDRCRHGQNTFLNPTKHCTVPFLNGGKIQYSVCGGT